MAFRVPPFVLSILCIALWMTTAAPSTACPFCALQGQSMSQAIDGADAAFIAELSGSEFKQAVTPGAPDGQTKARIIRVLKDHPAIQGKMEIVLPRYIPGAEKETITTLVYALVADGLVDPYSVKPVESKDLETYLIGSMEHRSKSPAERVGFFFNYLDHADTAIALDAYTEFAAAPYKDVKAAAKLFDPERILKWLHDPKTEPYRIGLYGLLLGISGGEKDKETILEILSDPKKRPLSGVDGLLGGLCVLDPKEGTDFTLKVLNDPENDFNYRYSALRTVKFILTDMPEVDPKMIFERMKPAIAVKDISDLIIDEFRKNKVWTPTEEVLALFNDPNFNVQVIKRAVVRYALQCPEESAAMFVERLRQENPQLVADVEEILRFEQAQLVKSPAPSPAP